ncbi:hypothetical protein TWF281_001388 [Arthrobotrys megalospora]
MTSTSRFTPLPASEVFIVITIIITTYLSITNSKVVVVQANKMGSLNPGHSPRDLHPTPPPPLHRQSTKSPHIKKAECIHRAKLPKGARVRSGITMSASSRSDPSCRPEGQLPGYIVEELVSQPDEPAGEAHMPIVHLPANIPPPIALSESGYPIGIAGPDGSPAWARPQAPSIKPPKNEHGHEHRCHKNIHRPHSHHHHHPATIQTGPEYLVPLGTPVPNPYGPGFIFLPPKDPRIIPCKPFQGLHHMVSYDDLNTVQGDNPRHRGNRLTVDPHIPGHYQVDEEINHEYTRMKLQAEQSERARFEEIERNQALWNARQKEYEKKIWLTAMGKKDEEPENDAGSFTRHTAASDEERVINVNVRHPCKTCKELVTIDTQVVHHRFSTHDGSQGIGINVNSPAPKLNAEILCEKCKVAEAEEEKSTDLLRKLVQQVFAEADTIKKSKRDEELSTVPSSRSRGVVMSDYLRPHDPRVALKHHKSFSSHHGKESSTRFENMPQNTSSKMNLHAHHSKHRLHNRPEAHKPNLYRDDSDSGSSSSSGEAQVAQPNPGVKLHKELSRSVLAALDKEHVFNRENVRILSSTNGDEDENEEEVIVIRRARRHNDNNNGSRSHPTLIKSATENPEDTIEAVARRLVNLNFSPVRADTYHGPTKLPKHAQEQLQGNSSESGSSEYSVSAKKQHRSTTQIHKRRTQTRIANANNHHVPATQHRRRRLHHEEHIIDNKNHSDNYGPAHGHYDDDPPKGHHRSKKLEATENAAPGFLSGWSLFRKATS